MGSNLNKALDSLSLIVNRYGVEDNSKKIELLKRISKIKLPLNETIHTYNELLLFICAFPNDAKILPQFLPDFLMIVFSGYCLIRILRSNYQVLKVRHLT